MSMSLKMSMSMSVADKGNGQVKNVEVTIMSMFTDMFVLIFMSLYMDMSSGAATARKNYDV